MITPYKGRTIDPTVPVFVYRNLHKAQWSVRQRGLVVGHADILTVLDATFNVAEGGRQKVIATGRKNVHAGVRGTLAPSAWVDGQRVSYNPHSGPFFVRAISGTPIHRADAVVFAANGKAYV